MTRIALDSKGVFRLPSMLHLPRYKNDKGYLVHCLLKILFGDDAPQPFFIENDYGRRMTVLGYTSTNPDELKHEASATADPEIYNIVDWKGLSSKEMPASWATGQRYGFQVRACPVIRKASAGPNFKKGAEVDVFLDACWQAKNDGENVDREEVYVNWLRKQLIQHGEVELVSAGMLAFKRSPLLRRNHQPKRTSHFCDRPDVLITGTLQVGDEVAFRQLLKRGIGRHRSFGFGMIMLRRGR